MPLPLFDTLERLQQNEKELFKELTDELHTHQPIVLSIMLSLPEKHPMPISDELMKLYLLVWSHFRSEPACRQKRLSENAFETTYQRNLNMLKYLEGETEKAEKRRITASDLHKVKSPELIAVIIHCLNHWPQLNTLNINNKGLELLSLKTLIEALEALTDN